MKKYKIKFILTRWKIAFALIYRGTIPDFVIISFALGIYKNNKLLGVFNKDFMFHFGMFYTLREGEEVKGINLRFPI